MNLRIAERAVGPGQPVLVVAELSANHGQRLDVAVRTVEAAARAGADAIKLQTYTPETLTLNSSSLPFVVRTDNAWAGRTLHDLYAEAMTPWEWHGELMEAARALGLICFSTPFDASAVAFLENLKVPAYKVASFELNDLPLVRHIARQGRPMILSTGMATLGEIEAAVAACRGVGNDSIALLRCVSAYPARAETLDLRSLRVLEAFDAVVGLSDHSRDDASAVAAVALGACIVEKHLTLDRSLGGPDAFFSLEPNEFSRLVQSIRTAEQSLGKVRFGPSSDELASLAFRRSLFVSQDVKAGETFTDDNTRSVRPAHGLPARYLPDVLGRPAAHDIAAATPLRWEHVGALPEVRVRLRPAQLQDSGLLLAWRNDALTRSMCRSREAVGEDAHAAWLRARLAAEPPGLFIAELDSVPVGQCRLDPVRLGVAEVALTLAPEARGRGLSVHLLRALEGEARRAGVQVLLATIRVENSASVRAFKRAGYYAFVPFSREGGDFIHCERALVS